MLDEGLAHYSALRVVEALRGADAAAAFRTEQRDKTIRLTGAGDAAPPGPHGAVPPGRP